MGDESGPRLESQNVSDPDGPGSLLLKMGQWIQRGSLFVIFGRFGSAFRQINPDMAFIISKVSL
jgi:hypothetical protein